MAKKVIGSSFYLAGFTGFLSRIDWVYHTVQLPAGHGEILRLQRHYKIADVSLNYHNTRKMGDFWGSLSILVKSIDLETTDCI
jgi:hypothetical protein